MECVHILRGVEGKGVCQAGGTPRLKRVTEPGSKRGLTVKSVGPKVRVERGEVSRISRSSSLLSLTRNSSVGGHWWGNYPLQPATATCTLMS